MSPIPGAPMRTAAPLSPSPRVSSASRRAPSLAAALLAALAFAGPAAGATDLPGGEGEPTRLGTRAACAAQSDIEAYPPIVNLRVDNDLLASQDQGYSSGVQLSLVSPNLRDYRDDPCLPWLARRINAHLTRLQPAGGWDQANMVVRFGQGIFTPEDPLATGLIADDRPYAGALLLGVGYNARRGDDLHATLLSVGVLGPSSRAEQTQRAIHRLTGSEDFRGWDNQLRDEGLLWLQHERSRRVGGRAGGHWDAVTHWGGGLGTPITYANAGFELRLGRRLPDDFGSSPVRLAGDNTAPGGVPRERRLAWHGFLATDAQWVLRDVTLDGNTWRRSHRVDRRPLLAEVTLGFAATRGRWKFALARTWRTREFEGQREAPSFGSFTVSRAM